MYLHRDQQVGFIIFVLVLTNSLLVNRFIGNVDLCGRQVQKPCRTSFGFPVVLPHAESDEAAGKSYTWI